MGVPEGILIALMGYGVYLEARQHGTVTKEEHNVWVTVAAHVILFGLLAWGGFFS